MSDPQLPGGFDMGSLMQSAQQMMQAQSQAAEQEVVGSAGGGAVEVTMTGGGEFLSVKIAATAVDPNDVDMLEDLVLAALNDAAAQVEEVQQGAMGGVDLGSLGGLGGLLGGADDDDG